MEISKIKILYTQSDLLKKGAELLKMSENHNVEEFIVD
jgi:hypothetical protein